MPFLRQKAASSPMGTCPLGLVRDVLHQLCVCVSVLLLLLLCVCVCRGGGMQFGPRVAFGGTDTSAGRGWVQKGLRASSCFALRTGPQAFLYPLALLAFSTCFALCGVYIT